VIVEQYQEFRIDVALEANEHTERWQKTGKGNGQGEYARLRQLHPSAEIKIRVRDVVLTQSIWKSVEPDEACSGSGMAHPAHGECRGYTTDRT
jgi:hypothetical protein